MICARIGLVYGCGLAAVMRKSFPKKLVYLAIISLLIANTINAAADLQAIAAGINMLVPVPIIILILPIALIILVVQVWGTYKTIEKVFRWLTLSLFAYIAAAVLAKPGWSEVIHGTFVPTLKLDSEFLSTLVAILGTTISPYLFFWQSNHEVEEKKAEEGAEPGNPSAKEPSCGMGRECRNAVIECCDVFHNSGRGRHTAPIWHEGNRIRNAGG